MAKTIFITGGATGIGRASVKKFLDEGWNVGFMDINADQAKYLLKKCNAGEEGTEKDFKFQNSPPQMPK